MSSNEPTGARPPLPWSAIESAIRYRIPNQDPGTFHTARSMKICGTGILFETAVELTLGQHLEIFIDWPASQNGACMVTLAARGMVVRLRGGMVEVAFESGDLRARLVENCSSAGNPVAAAQPPAETRDVVAFPGLTRDIERLRSQLKLVDAAIAALEPLSAGLDPLAVPTPHPQPSQPAPHLPNLPPELHHHVQRKSLRSHLDMRLHGHRRRCQYPG